MAGKTLLVTLELCMLKSAPILTSVHGPYCGPLALSCVLVELSGMKACFPVKQMHWCSKKDDTGSRGAGLKPLCPRTTCTPRLGLC